MCSKFPLSNGLQYWLHPLYRLQFALSNDFVLAAACVSMFYSYCYPTVYYTGYIYSLSSDCLLAATCVSIFYSYCYPTVYYTGYHYSLSNDFILAAIYVSLSLISVVQRFCNTGDTIYTNNFTPHLSNSRFFCVIQRLSFPIIFYLHAPPPPLPVFFLKPLSHSTPHVPFPFT